jgi:hypothetical protein
VRSNGDREKITAYTRCGYFPLETRKTFGRLRIFLENAPASLMKISGHTVALPHHCAAASFQTRELRCMLAASPPVLCTNAAHGVRA